jgi:hypothetical protein
MAAVTNVLREPFFDVCECFTIVGVCTTTNSPVPFEETQDKFLKVLEVIFIFQKNVNKYDCTIYR